MCRFKTIFFAMTYYIPIGRYIAEASMLIFKTKANVQSNADDE